MIAANIMRCGQLAAALEVSGWPKPGNVHRTADFHDTTYEHFLAGAIALGPTLQKAAEQGMNVGLERLDIQQIRIGRLIKEAVTDVQAWHRGGNTHLGVSLLFVPLAVAAGLTHVSTGAIRSLDLRGNVVKVTEGTTPQDARDVYDAILLASSAALGTVEGDELPDLTDKDASDKLIERKITLYDVMAASSRWDNLSREWVTGLEICFKTGHAMIVKTYQETKDLNITIVHTFLSILAKYPDTFIARKVGTAYTPHIGQAVQIGLKETRWVSEVAATVLKAGGLTTKDGSKRLWDFDNRLRVRGGAYNPGTTADLTAGSLMISLLCGFRF